MSGPHPSRLAFLAVFCLALIWCPASRATVTSGPYIFDKRSENGRFVVHFVPAIDGSKPVMTVSQAGGQTTNSTWRAVLHRDIYSHEVWVSDDGESVVLLNDWDADVLAVYNKRGLLAKYSSIEFGLRPKERKEEPLPTSNAERRIWQESRLAYQEKVQHWRESREYWYGNTIEFFHTEAGQLLFCIRWNSRWIVLHVGKGQLENVSPELANRLNTVGRARALKSLPTSTYPPAEMNFLGLLGVAEDRPLIENWLRNGEFEGSCDNEYSTGQVKLVSASSQKRAIADRILSVWDGEDREAVEARDWNKYRFLGTLKGTVIFRTEPSRGGAIHIYLIPESTPLNAWASSKPTPSLTVNQRLINGGTLSSNMNFAIYGVTPGSYRIKVVWDDIVTIKGQWGALPRPQSGGYESTTSPVISIRKGGVIEGIKIQCQSPVGK